MDEPQGQDAASGDVLRKSLSDSEGKRKASPEQGPYDFASVVDRFQARLLHYVSRMVGPDGALEPEDLVQEAFMRLHRQVVRHGEWSVKDMGTWLFRVAHNLVMDQGRRLRREERALERAQARAEPAPAPDAAGQTMHREACEKAVDELHKLPGDQKEVLLLRIVQGMTLREIGEVTGLTPGNAAYRIDQGLRELARRLRAAGVV